MDKYNHWLGRLFAKVNHSKEWAITIGQTTYYSCDEMYVTHKWRAHEDHHKLQFRLIGFWKFSLLYIWTMIRYGYWNNPYEIEARVSSESIYKS